MMPKFILITGRTSKQGVALHKGKDSDEYRQATGFVEMNHLDRERLGVEVRPLPADLAQNLGLPRGGGFVVVEVEPGSPAGRIGMRSRDVFVALGRYYPTTLEELGQLLEHLEPAEQVSVTYLRVKPPTIIRYEDVLAVR